jgi:hypothetical protein
MYYTKYVSYYTFFRVGAKLQPKQQTQNRNTGQNSGVKTPKPKSKHWKQRVKTLKPKFKNQNQSQNNKKQVKPPKPESKQQNPNQNSKTLVETEKPSQHTNNQVKTLKN